MEVVLGVVVVVVVIIAELMDKGSIFAKTVLACFIAAIAFLLIYLITRAGLFTTLAKICGAGAILTALIGIIKKLFGL